MTHFNIFNYKGVFESREVALGPKDPPPEVIGLNTIFTCLLLLKTFAFKFNTCRLSGLNYATKYSGKVLNLV